MRLNDKALSAITNMQTLEKEIRGLEGQKKELDRAVVEINKLLKEFKGNKSLTMQAIVGQNLIRRLHNKECVTTLEKRKAQTEIALSSADEQINHRQDHLQEESLRIFFILKNILPEDMISDADNEDG